MKKKTLSINTSLLIHDLKNLVSFINQVSHKDEQEEKTCNKNNLLEDLKKIHHCGQKLMELIQNTLALIKSNEVEASLLDIHETIESILLIHQQKIIEKKLNISKNIPKKFVKLNQSLIYQLFDNLISNAIKYSFQESTISINLDTEYVLVNHQKHIKIIFDIENEGPCIQDSNSIFQLFKRDQKDFTKEGHGVGLYLAQEIASYYQGTIQLIKNTQSKIKFQVDILAPEFILPSAKKYSLLICDDSEDFLKIIEEELKSFHCELFFARNGKEALKFLQQHSIHGILMDLKMPLMDGKETILKIRQQINFNSIPIAVFTNGTQAKTIKTIAPLVQDFFLKPVPSDRLFNFIEAHIIKKDLSTQNLRGEEWNVLSFSQHVQLKVSKNLKIKQISNNSEFIFLLKKKTQFSYIHIDHYLFENMLPTERSLILSLIKNKTLIFPENLTKNYQSFFNEHQMPISSITHPINKTLDLEKIINSSQSFQSKNKSVKKQILLFDDFWGNRLLFEKLAKKHGWQFHYADQVSHCLDILLKQKMDFIFLDLNIGDLDIGDLIPIIKNILEEKSYQSKIILFSTVEEIQKRSHILYYDSYLTKPTTVENILKIINDC